MPAAGDADLRRLVKEHIEPVMDARGFARHKQKLFWSRQTDEVEQAIALLRRRGTVDMQWALIVPEATPLLWGRPQPPADIGFHVMSGAPSNVQHPAPGQSFALSELTTEVGYDNVASQLRRNVELVANFITRFETRRQIRTHLMAADHHDHRDFVMPARGLVIPTAAALAILDREPERLQLVEEAVARLQRNPGPTSLGRIERLRAALA